jgi:hypothetical protein
VLEIPWYIVIKTLLIFGPLLIFSISFFIHFFRVAGMPTIEEILVPVSLLLISTKKKLQILMK